MGKSRIVTLNIEPDEIRFVVVDGRRVTNWGSEPLEPGFVKDGLILEPPEAASIIDSFLRTRRLTRGHVVCSIAGVRSLPRILTLPKIERKMIEEAITFEAERQMPLPLSELYLAHRHLGDTDTESQFFVVGASRERVDAQTDMLEMAGLKSFSLDLNAIALARAVNSREALIIDMEPSRSEIVLVADGIPLIARTLYLRGQDMIAEERVREVAIEASRTLEFYRSKQTEQPRDEATPIFLTGKLASDPHIMDLARAAISESIETPELALEYPSDLPVADYITNFGLAMKGRTGKREIAETPGLYLDLVPDSQKPHKVNKKLWYSIVAAVALFALLFVTYPLHLDSQAASADLEFKLENIRQQMLDVEETLASIQSIESDISDLREETLEVLGPEASFVEGLDSIFSEVPEGVTPTTITMTGDLITVEGIASSRPAAIDYVVLIDETGVFSTVTIASLTPLGRADSSAESTKADDVQFIITIER